MEMWGKHFSNVFNQKWIDLTFPTEYRVTSMHRPITQSEVESMIMGGKTTKQLDSDRAMNLPRQQMSIAGGYTRKWRESVAKLCTTTNT
jgi:hypothetical protein